MNVIPLITVHAKREREAWQAYKCLCLFTAQRPDLSENPFWQAIMHDAHRRWEALFEVA